VKRSDFLKCVEDKVEIDLQIVEKSNRWNLNGTRTRIERIKENMALVFNTPQKSLIILEG
jgi:hypothetical protein